MASNSSSAGRRGNSSGNRSKSNQSASSNNSRSNRSKQSGSGGIGGFIEAVKQRPLASAAIAAGAAGASAFLWAKRSQIGDQFTELTGGDDQADATTSLNASSELIGGSGSSMGSSSSANTGARRRGRPSKASLDALSDDQTEVGAIAYGA